MKRLIFSSKYYGIVHLIISLLLLKGGCGSFKSHRKKGRFFLARKGLFVASHHLLTVDSCGENFYGTIDGPEKSIDEAFGELLSFSRPKKHCFLKTSLLSAMMEKNYWTPKMELTNMLPILHVLYK